MSRLACTVVFPTPTNWHPSTMRFNLAIASFILSALCTDSIVRGEAIVKNLWPDAPPGPASKVSGEESDQTKQEDKLIAGRRIIKLGNVSAPLMHVYLPMKDKANGGAILICPGGGFSILAWDLEGTEVAEWLNSIGFAAVVVKYRVKIAG